MPRTLSHPRTCEAGAQRPAVNEQVFWQWGPQGRGLLAQELGQGQSWPAAPPLYLLLASWAWEMDTEENYLSGEKGTPPPGPVRLSDSCVSGCFCSPEAGLC